jgi:hypothetical protein
MRFIPGVVRSFEDLNKEFARLSQLLEPINNAANYIQVTEAERYLYQKELVRGVNVIGVATNLDTTIYIPAALPQEYLILIKDELGVAGIHPITVEVY